MWDKYEHMCRGKKETSSTVRSVACLITHVHSTLSPSARPPRQLLLGSMHSAMQEAKNDLQRDELIFTEQQRELKELRTTVAAHGQHKLLQQPSHVALELDAMQAQVGG